MFALMFKMLRAWAANRASPTYRVYDQTGVAPNPKKTYGPRTAASPLIVVHVTAVRGGFSVTAAAAARLGARTPALLERYAQLPYHWMAARADEGIVVHNHTPFLRTIHGHAGNRGIGVAIDCDWDEPLTEVLIGAGRTMMHEALAELRAATGASTVFVAPHRVFSNTRLNDPGPRVWADIVLPAVTDCPFARILYDHCEGTGRPVPNTWDARSRFNPDGTRA